MSDLDLILTSANNLFREYIKNEYQITFEENDLLLLLVENRDFGFKLPPTPPQNIISDDDYKKYLSEYFTEYPNKKTNFDTGIKVFKINIEIAKQKKENLKNYFIETYNLNDDHLFGRFLTIIIEKYDSYSKKNRNKNIDNFLQDSEIQTFINKEIQKNLKLHEQIEKTKEIKKSKSIASIKRSSKKNKEEELNVKINKEEELNVKINKADDKLKELSGLDNGEIASVINDVMIIIKENINNKTEELELKEKIIYYLNEGRTKDLRDLIRDLIH